MRRRFAGLFAAAVVSVFAAASCGGSTGEDLQRRAEDEARKPAADGIQRERTRVEEGVDGGLTRLEDRVRGETQQGEGGQ